MSSSTTEPGRLAEEAHRRGDFAEAIRLQRDAVESKPGGSAEGIDARKRLALYHYSAGEHAEALEQLETLAGDAPDDVDLWENRGVLLRLLGRREEAIEVLLEAYERDPDRFNVCDALAHSLAASDRGEEMVRFGSRALELKDAQAAAIEPAATVPDDPPPALGSRPGRKLVIAFSLWGTRVRYLQGAIRNVLAAYDIYPGWKCRFYCDDSVPGHVRRQLVRHGAEVILKPRPESFFDGLMWRFEVIGDESVDRFLVRDCDSVVSVQERVAVDAWIRSERWFHAMRDFPSHTEVLLAGLWGGVQGALPPLEELRARFRPKTAPTRTFDQVFLRECVWPVVRQSVLVHDSVYTGCLGSEPFPELGRQPHPFHVGQNEAAVRKDVVVDLPVPKPGEIAPVVLVSGDDDDAVSHVSGSLVGSGLLTKVGEGSLRAWIREVEDCSARFSGHENSSDDPRAIAGRVGPLLAALCSDAMAAADSGCVLVDDTGDDLLRDALADYLGAKILSVIRDPRDTASERRLGTEKEALAWARRWVASIDSIAARNRNDKGTIELVRCEDWTGPAGARTRRRLADFIELDGELPEPGPEGAPESGMPLPEELAVAIESVAAKSMRKLNYLPAIVTE